MSQHKLATIEKHPGGLLAAKAIAEKMGVHLLLVEDEEGSQIVAASKRPFQVIC